MKNLLPVFLVLTSCSGAPTSQVAVGSGRVTLTSAKVVAEAAPDLGGRIVSYRMGDVDILQKDRGCQFDIGPESRQIPPHAALWSGAYVATALGTSGVRLTSQPDGGLGLQVVKELGIDGASGALEVVGKMRNVSKQETSYCFWDRTLCAGGGWTLLPVNPKSKFKAGWALGKRKGGNLWEYDGEGPAHGGVRLMDGVLVVKTGGAEQKLGTDAMDGWIAYTRGRLLFAKYYPCYPAGKYSDGGLTLAHYFREAAVAELEPLSPEVALKPGQEYVFPQLWVLIPLDKEVGSFEEARALVSLLPKSPFK